MTIGQRIKAQRELLGLTQEELGAACGTTKQTIFKYETGVITNIPMDRLCTIADKLKVSPAVLIGWEEDSAPADSSELTSAEAALIEDYRKLNEDGQEAARRTLRAFTNLPEYKVLPGSGKVAEDA